MNVFNSIFDANKRHERFSRKTKDAATNDIKLIISLIEKRLRDLSVSKQFSKMTILQKRPISQNAEESDTYKFVIRFYSKIEHMT